MSHPDSLPREVVSIVGAGNPSQANLVKPRLFLTLAPLGDMSPGVRMINVPV